MGCIWLQADMTRRYKFGMPPVESKSTPTGVIRPASIVWHGLHKANVSLQAALIRQYKSGTPPLVAISSPITAILAVSWPWRGHPQRVLLRAVWTAPSTFGMRRNLAFLRRAK